jgi:hypothetical protein
MEVMTLWPFSQGELEGVREGFIDAVFASRLQRLAPLAKWDERKEIRRRALGGGFPEVRTRPTTERRKAWYGSYLTTLLQRDVRDLSRIEDLTAMPRLLAILAARTGGLLNTADISRSSGIVQTTLKRYLSLLQTRACAARCWKTLSAWNCASRLPGAKNIPSFFIGGHTANKKSI